MSTATPTAPIDPVPPPPAPALPPNPSPLPLIAGNNTAPVLQNLSPSRFLENTVNAAPRVLDPQVTLIDRQGNFDGGSIVVTGLLPEDSVSVLNLGRAAGQVGFAAGDVSYGGVVVGQAVGGNAGATLRITFNAQATARAVEAVLESLAYANASDTPTASRTLTITVTDAAGAVQPNLAQPSFAQAPAARDPFNGITIVGGENPVLVDLDRDGDLDLVVGTASGAIAYLKNTGSATAPQFVPQSAAGNPFAHINLAKASPTFGDLDGDGDLDMVVGQESGGLLYYRNDGSSTAPQFVQIANSIETLMPTSLAIPTFGTNEETVPTLGDLDGDGDLDLVVGDLSGRVFIFENGGNAQASGFAREFSETLLRGSEGRWSSPLLVDVDSDGDLDLVVGRKGGDLGYVENIGTATEQQIAVDDGNTFAALAVPGYTADAFNLYNSAAAFGDLDGDGDLDAVIEIGGSTFQDGPSGELVRVTDDRLYTFINTPSATASSLRVEVVSQADAARLQGLATSLSTVENAAPVLLDADVQFSAGDGSLAGSRLTVSGLLPEDTVAVRHQGNSAGQVALAGASLSYGGTVIGSLVGGNAGAALTVSFNAAATAVAVEAVIQSLTYVNLSEAPTASRSLAIEFSRPAGGTMPSRATQLSFEEVTAPSEFNTVAAGTRTTPTFADLDNDGDADLLVGRLDGSPSLAFYKNTGSATAPVWTAQSGADNPFSALSEAWLTPDFGDVDGDGDFDLVAGTSGGQLLYMENTGSAAAPRFVQRTGAANPFEALTGIEAYAAPALGDIDGDGDLDLLVGDLSNSLNYFENLGTAQAAQYQRGTVDPNRPQVPLYGIRNGVTKPAIGDIDADGDLDVVVGDVAGQITLWNNSGSATSPRFAFEQALPYGVLDGGGGTQRLAAPTFVDYNGDGRSDVVWGTQGGALLARPQSGEPSVNPFVANSFSDNRVTAHAAPAIADLDSDGDLDAVVGSVDGTLVYMKTEEQQVYERANTAGFFNNPLRGYTGPAYAVPALADLDGDGDLDAIVGTSDGALRMLENIGSPFDPLFEVRAGAANPLNGVDVGDFARPALADVDGDGDVDAVVGSGAGNLRYFENSGNLYSASFTEKTGAANPFGSLAAGSWATPAFGDIDNDGDLDLVIGGSNGRLRTVENTGSATAPAYVERSGAANPFDDVFVSGGFSTVSFADVNHDGDVDLFVGGQNGSIRTFVNVSAREVGNAITVNVSAINDGPTAAPLTLAPMAEDSGPRTITRASLLAGATDVDSSTISLVALTVQSGGGSVAVMPSGDWSYTPAPNDDSAVTFAYTVSDGALSATSTAALDITPVADPAVIGNPSAASVTEDVAVNSNGQLVAAGTLSIRDPDAGEATFRTTVLPAAGNLGTLTLAADGSYSYGVANADVQSLAAGASRVERFTVTAFDGTAKELSFTINGANDAPRAAALESASLAYTENGAALAVTSTLALSDIDSATLSSAEIKIKSNYDAAGDVLGFAAQAGISGLWDAATGTLNLSGNATVAQYQSALRSVTYRSTSDNPSTAPRSLDFSVNDGLADSAVVSRSIAVTATNDPTTGQVDLVQSTNATGQTVLTVVSTLADPDGLTVSYQWQLSSNGGNTWAPVAGATGASYTLPAAQQGVLVRATVLATDAFGSVTFTTARSAVVGGAGNQTLTGDSGDNLIDAGAGNDTVFGNAGNDELRGGTGNDALYGGTGSDLLTGDDGNDSLFGEGGDDDVRGGTGNDAIFGGSGKDRLVGDEGNDNLFGDDGDDWLAGGSGNDLLDGGAGNDRFVVAADDGDDTYLGGLGSDTLDLSATSADAVVNLGGMQRLGNTNFLGLRAESAEIGKETLLSIENVVGGAGSDTLIASWDQNVMTGGAGADRFVFASNLDAGNSASTRDQIVDFTPGLDRIDLSAMDAQLLAFGDQAFGFAGLLAAGVVPGPGQLGFRFETVGNITKTIVVGNIGWSPSDMTPDFQIELIGQVDLSAADFLL